MRGKRNSSVLHRILMIDGDLLLIVCVSALFGFVCIFTERAKPTQLRVLALFGFVFFAEKKYMDYERCIFQVLQLLFGTFFALITSIHSNLEKLLKNRVFLRLTWKNSFAPIFIIIFVFSTSNYVSIHVLSIRRCVTRSQCVSFVPPGAPLKLFFLHSIVERRCDTSP